MPCTLLTTDDRRLTTVFPQRYLPFGEVRTDVGTAITQTDFGYTGQRNVAGFGLMDYNPRFYSPYLNRWTQPDSIIPDLTDSQSWNRFSYVQNNPINYNDPTGHVMEGACGFGGGECGTDTGGPWPQAGHPRGYYDALPTPQERLEAEFKREEERQAHIDYCFSVNWTEPDCYNIPDGFCDENPYAPECTHFMDGNPSPQSPYYVRNADYGTFSFGTAIPNPITLTLVGWHFNLTKDRFGQWYIGLGLDVGDSALGADGSLVWGSSKTILPPEELKDYVSGFSVDYGLGFLGYLGGSTNIPGGTNLEAGIASPQVGVGFTYVWVLP